MNDSSRRQAHTYNPAIKLTFSPVFPSLRYSMAFRKPSKGTCVFYHSCGSDLDSSAFVEQPVQRFVVETTSSAYIVCVIHRVASSATCLRRELWQKPNRGNRFGTATCACPTHPPFHTRFKLCCLMLVFRSTCSCCVRGCLVTRVPPGCCCSSATPCRATRTTTSSELHMQ